MFNTTFLCFTCPPPPTPSYCLLPHPFSAWFLLVSLGYFAWSIAFQTFWCPELPSRPNRVCTSSCSLCSDPSVPKPHAFLSRNKQLHFYTFCFLFFFCSDDANLLPQPQTKGSCVIFISSLSVCQLVYFGMLTVISLSLSTFIAHEDC